MVQILWKDGKEPPDAAVLTGEGKTNAGYVGTGGVNVPVTKSGKEETRLDAKPDLPEQLQHTMADTTYKPLDPDKVFGGMNAKCAAMLKRNQRPVEGLQTESTTGESTVRAPATPHSVELGKGKQNDHVAMPVRRLLDPALTGSLIRARTGSTPRPATVSTARANCTGSMPVMMSLYTKDSVAVSVGAISIEKPKPKAEVTKFPLSNEQLKKDAFYQATGASQADIQDLLQKLLEPGWTVASVLSPHEQAWRLSCRVRDCRYGIENCALKVKKAVHNFLHKKRPLK